MKWYYWVLIGVAVLGLGYFVNKMFGKDGIAKTKKDKTKDGNGSTTVAETAPPKEDVVIVDEGGDAAGGGDPEPIIKVA